MLKGPFLVFDMYSVCLRALQFDFNKGILVYPSCKMLTADSERFAAKWFCGSMFKATKADTKSILLSTM